MIHSPELSIISNCTIHDTARISGFVNLYDCTIGEFCFVGPFVEIGGARIGARTKVSSHSYVCPGVEIGTDCFIAHGVEFCNDAFTSPPTYDNISELANNWKTLKTKVGNSVRIGSGATLLPGITIGDHCVIGAGSTVTHDMPSGSVWAGNPARAMLQKSIKEIGGAQ